MARRRDAARAEAGRDWWPLAIDWATTGAVPQRPAVVVRPHSTEEVSAVLAACNEASVPVTAMAGRSGVCGGSIPVHGGVSLDLTALEGLVRVDEVSLTADVRAGTFGPDLEDGLGHIGGGYTLGHWPQSMELSTVGGWLACRGAGQYSTRYGKIEDMVIGLEVVLADGRVLHTEGHGPRAATGPNLTQLFVGSEGTLGVITEARLRMHPHPAAQERRAFGFTSFPAGLEACRRILRRGATPAVLRLYDTTESARNFEQPDTNVLVVLDETDPVLLAATMAVVDAECGADARVLPTELVERWLGHRNDVSQLAPLWRGGIVVDTVEISGPWAALPTDSSSEVIDFAQVRSRGPWSLRPTSPTPTPTAPACTSPSPAAVPRAATTVVAPQHFQDRATAACLGHGDRGDHRAGRRHQPSPWHRPEPLALLARGPRDRLRRPGRAEADLRPHRDPQPGQVRPVVALRAAPVVTWR